MIFLQSKFKVSMYAARFALLAHYLFVLSLSPTIGRCISRVRHFELKTFTPLIPALVQAFFCITYPIIWRNPFESFEAFPYLFVYLSLSSCAIFISLQTILIEIYTEKVISIFLPSINLIRKNILFSTKKQKMKN